jgi:acetyltransferase-like isoleucine patch superfamily enzyme
VLNLSPDRHFVLIAADLCYAEIRNSLRQAGLRLGKDYFDLSAPLDMSYRGVPIGKGSYFADSLDVRFVKRIGRFCSMNFAVQIGVNHQMNMVTTSDGVGHFFLGAHKNLFLREMTTDQVRRVPENKVSIGNDVWIGANVFINSSRCAVIGDGAIVGAGSIVMHDVPPYAIVYGQPARVQRYRFTPGQIETLLRVRWWDWDDETLDQNAEMLIFPEKFFERFG